MSYKEYKQILDNMQGQLKVFAECKMESRYTVVREMFINFSSINPEYCKKYMVGN